MTDHLGYDKGDAARAGTENSRDRTTAKTMAASPYWAL